MFESSKKDDSKVIFLSGSGSVFCSGLDLRCIQTSSVEERKRASKNLADAVRYRNILNPSLLSHTNMQSVSIKFLQK